MRALLLIAKNNPPKLRAPDLWSTKFKNFLECTLVKDPSKRLLSSQLLQVLNKYLNYVLASICFKMYKRSIKTSYKRNERYK